MGWPDQGERVDLGIAPVLNRLVSIVFNAEQCSTDWIGYSILMLFFLTIAPQRCDSACMNAA
jgi:hypothetical protein